MLDPTWLRVHLGNFLLGSRYRIAGMINHQGPRTYGALIKSEKVFHWRRVPFSLV
jgi:hypothetical protein